MIGPSWSLSQLTTPKEVEVSFQSLLRNSAALKFTWGFQRYRTQAILLLFISTFTISVINLFLTKNTQIGLYICVCITYLLELDLLSGVVCISRRQKQMKTLLRDQIVERSSFCSRGQALPQEAALSGHRKGGRILARWAQLCCSGSGSNVGCTVSAHSPLPPSSIPGASEVKATACNAGDPGSIPGLGRSPGKGNGSPPQQSCLENPMDGGALWAIVHGVAKSRTRLSDFSFSSRAAIRGMVRGGVRTPLQGPEAVSVQHFHTRNCGLQCQAWAFSTWRPRSR